MSKRKRRRQIKLGRASQRVSTPVPSREQGFDFGLEVHALAVSDISFIGLLGEAEVVACAYGYVGSGPLGVPMFEMSLVGTNPEPLRKAFTEFKRWAASSDGDAVELTFTFLKEGGYVLSICREHTRALRDLLGSGRTFSPILIGGTYIKRFDTRNPTVERFREFKSKHLISPFLFGAATVGRNTGTPPAIQDVSPLPDVEPLVKFEAGFLDEHATQPGSPHYSTIAMIHQPRSLGRKKRRPHLPPPPKPSQQPAIHFRHRAEILQRHFPVTVERIRAGRYPHTTSALQQKGVKDWQLEQAVANLLLSSSICNGQLFYANVPPEDLPRRVGEAIQQREERSDTPELTRFSTQDIVTQVQLDALALLRLEGQTISISSGLDSLQKRLSSLNLLEPPNA